MMREFLFSTVYNLVAQEIPGKRFEFFDQCYLSTDERVLKNCFSNIAKVYVGACEQGAAFREGAFIYSELPDELLCGTSDVPRTVLKGWLEFIRGFFLALWFIKDNAVDCELGFAHYFSEIEGEMYSTNYIAALNHDASGGRKKIAFSLEELRSARMLFQKEILPAVMPEAFGSPRKITSLKWTKSVTKESSRVTRFLYFLSGARIQEDISIRLSQYMTTLEVLFGTDTSELVYKLSERVAFFLGEDASTRRRIFDTVRNVYKIRSKVVHGDAVAAKDMEEARDTSNEVDQLVREVGLKILSDAELKVRFNGRKENLEEYFIELVMGK
jgi:Apea-like HEPN